MELEQKEILLAVLSKVIRVKLVVVGVAEVPDLLSITEVLKKIFF